MSEKSKFQQGYELYEKLRNGYDRKVIIKRMIEQLGMNKATANTYYYQYTKLKKQDNKDKPAKYQNKPRKKNNWLQVNSIEKTSDENPEIEDVLMFTEHRTVGEVHVIQPIFKNADRNDQQYVLSGDKKKFASRIEKGMRSMKLFDNPYLKYDNNGNTFVAWNCKIPAYTKDMEHNLRKLGV